DYFFRVFFFFQAEDGIRDGHVTGVQTCALPISQIAKRSSTRSRIAASGTTRNSWASGGLGIVAGRSSAETRSDLPGSNPRRSRRSEERRVGKECRAGWSPCQ